MVENAAMAAVLVWPAGRLAAPRSLSKKGTLLDEVSRYVQKSQRIFLSSKSGTRVTVVAKKAVKGHSRGGNVAEAAKESGDILWTSRAGWACVKNCGACCVLDKGPDYPPIEEVLTDPAESSLYRSMIGPDGWCINYDKRSRSCKIHADRPRFCRVEPDIFKALYGIEEKDMDKEACGFCQDQIRSVYGGRSKELKTFQRVVRSLKKSS